MSDESDDAGEVLAQVRDLAGAGVMQAACGTAHTLFLCRRAPNQPNPFSKT